MKPILVRELAQWIGGRAVGFHRDSRVSGFCLDSNSVNSGDLFLAIKGARVDGHSFVPQVLAAGAVGTLAEKPVSEPYILVDNLVDALAKLGGHFRSQFDGPVVAITGSAGKTTTKEFVASALSPLGPVLKTPGNRNSEYTSPLLWTELGPEHRSVVVEMAMRGFGQIAHLASFTMPNVGLVTNIGYAHMEMVGSRAGIADAKGELLESLPEDGAAVLWHEDDLLALLRPKTSARTYTFGMDAGADCQITEYQPIDWYWATVKGTCEGKTWAAKMPATGRHIALNVAAAVMVATALGIEPELAAAQIEYAVIPPMRMEVVERNGATILLDNYNASPPSMIAAIETLAELPVKGRRFAVIGEMRELGNYADASHRAVGVSLGKAGFDQVLFYGPSTALAAEEALANGLAAEAISTAASIDDVRRFLARMQAGDAALVKGSRALELERALDREVHS